MGRMGPTVVLALLDCVLLELLGGLEKLDLEEVDLFLFVFLLQTNILWEPLQYTHIA